MYCVYLWKETSYEYTPKEINKNHSVLFVDLIGLWIGCKKLWSDGVNGLMTGKKVKFLGSHGNSLNSPLWSFITDSQKSVHGPYNKTILTMGSQYLIKRSHCGGTVKPFYFTGSKEYGSYPKTFRQQSQRRLRRESLVMMEKKNKDIFLNPKKNCRYRIK